MMRCDLRTEERDGSDGEEGRKEIEQGRKARRLCMSCVWGKVRKMAEIVDWKY
jgi:hypothetical protein